MRKLLFQGLIRRPFTERAPSPDDAAVTELAQPSATPRGGASDGAFRSAKSTPAPAMDANSRSMHSTTPTTISNASVMRFVASPRHADVLLVTGPVTKNMREALERTYHATPSPKWVVAVGDCAPMAAASLAAMRSSAAFPKWFPSISIYTVVHRRRRHAAGAALRCSNRTAKSVAPT